MGLGAGHHGQCNDDRYRADSLAVHIVPEAQRHLRQREVELLCRCRGHSEADRQVPLLGLAEPAHGHDYLATYSHIT